jgi:hypothetical protein
LEPAAHRDRERRGSIAQSLDRIAAGRAEDFMNTGLVFGSPIDGLLERLYAQNLAQDEVLADYFTTRANEGSLDRCFHHLSCCCRPG